MGNLRDQLIGKGLVGEKRARAIAHEEKARRNKIGQDAVEEERRTLDAQRRDSDQSRRETDRKRELERQREEDAKRAGERLVRLVRDRALTSGVRGSRRFHFVCRARTIPWLDVSDEAAGRLERGQLAICEVPGTGPEEFVLLPRDAALELRAALPDHVLFLNGEA